MSKAPPAEWHGLHWILCWFKGHDWCVSHENTGKPGAITYITPQKCKRCGRDWHE